MKIVIDGRMYEESGIGRYIRNLLSNLIVLDKKNEYFILHLKKDFDNLIYKDNFHKVLADFRWYSIEEQIKLPKLISTIKPNLVHFPHFNIPLLFEGNFVVTIHDLIHQHFEMKRASTLNPLFYKIKQLGYKKVFKHAIEKAKHILVPSEYVKNLLVNEWQVDDEKITITYESVDDKIFKIIKRLTKKEINEVLEKFQITSPYIFYVGNAHPHKNVEGLINIFLQIKKRYNGLRLVLSGNDHYFWQRVKQYFADKDIIYTGRISDEELVSLYKGAECFVMPSLEEGFGIPLLESMACECPVVSSNKGSLPEVGGEAAIYFDPLNKEDFLNALTSILDNGLLSKKLIGKGKKRVKDFSWHNLAKQTLDVYRIKL